jgi:hypothetical protein
MSALQTRSADDNCVQRQKHSSLNYEGKVKSSRPSLCETRDIRLLGRVLERSWCHRHKEYNDGHQR